MVELSLGLQQLSQILFCFGFVFVGGLVGKQSWWDASARAWEIEQQCPKLVCVCVCVCQFFSFRVWN